MDLTKKGLSEFKRLMKESSKDWDKNKIRFGERVVEPEREIPTNKIQIQQDPSTKEKRKRQVDLGHMILGYFKEEVSSPKKSEVENIGPGRPRKEREEKVRVISLKIRPEYVEFLKGLSFGRGIGSRIRIIIDDWNRFKKREKEQVGVLRKALGELDGALKRYARNFDRNENYQKNEETLKELGKACNNIKILMNVLKFEIGELRGMLSKEEYRNIEFAYGWANNYDGGPS
jgi:hypothetical protein